MKTSALQVTTNYDSFRSFCPSGVHHHLCSKEWICEWLYSVSV